MERLSKFRLYRKEMQDSGKVYCQALKEIQESLQAKEVLDSSRSFRGQKEEGTLLSACPDPLEGHHISREFRTKMTDWMVEVCTSFKCCPRTYFLAVTLFDKYMVACHKQGRVLTNADIHYMGITSIYLASKFEDVFPLHSKVVS